MFSHVAFELVDQTSSDVGGADNDLEIVVCLLGDQLEAVAYAFERVLEGEVQDRAPGCREVSERLACNDVEPKV